MNAIQAMAVRLNIKESDIDSYSASYDYTSSGECIFIVITKTGEEKSLVLDRNYHRLFGCEFGHRIAASIETRLKSTSYMETWGIFADECFTTIAKAHGYNNIWQMIRLLESTDMQTLLDIVMGDWGSLIPDNAMVIATGKTRKEWLQIEKEINPSIPRLTNS
jgi:hypothetical protein